MPYTLKQARNLREKTQAEMAAEMGICRDTYRSIEANPEQATVQQAKQICAILNMEIEDIFFDS
ncbi:MAG: helix-turn-helix transcriptional regulator [Acutalibacteraceae bacterium]